MTTATRSIAQQVAALPSWERDAILADMSDAEVAALEYDWAFWARPHQLAPADRAWKVWLILAGRGYGKTRTAAEQVLLWAREPKQRIALVAETAADARDVIVEGESGILACAPPWARPKYEPSKRRVTWPNGTIATTYSGDDPEQLRGPQHHKAHIDELGKYRYADDLWSNLELGLRLGEQPQVVVATTPRPIPVLRALLKDPGTVVTRGNTYENQANLAQSFFDRIRSKYEGTRLGRQELYAELLEDTPGALWTRADLDTDRVAGVPALRRIVVGLDPGSDAGIIVAGLGEDLHGYILDDASVSGAPMGWARQAIAAYTRHRANVIIAEKNHGAEMVETTLRTVDPQAAIETVWASQGKYARAEPVSALYAQHRVHHVGAFPLLEDELCSWVPGEGLPSPNRLDACVWALTALMLTGPAAETASAQEAPEHHYAAARGGRYGLVR
mgnify:CR=1 FL=1